MNTKYEAYLSKRTPPQNLLPEDMHLFAKEFEREIPAIGVLELKKAYVLNDTIFDRSKLTFHDSFTHLFGLSWKYKLKRLLLFKESQNTIHSGIWVTNEWTKGYFHWITEALPKLMLTAANLPVLLPEGYRDIPFVLSSLTKLGYTPFYYKPTLPLKVDNLCLPTHTGPTGNYNIHVINNLRTLFLSKMVPVMPFRKIYLSRQKAPRRKITNETEVALLLQKYGYEIHFFEDYSFEKQVKIMTEATHLVGLHGAGLTNMLFMQKGGKVLELRNKNDDHNNCYFTLASDLDHKYFYLCNNGDSENTHDVQLIIDISQLNMTLTAMA